MSYHSLAAEQHSLEALTDHQTWCLLWSHAAHQIISSISATSPYEHIAIGVGWGLRKATNHRCALLVHPNMQDRAVGDLALTVLGSGTHVIPRCGRSYVDYLQAVAEIVEITARAQHGS